MRLYVDIAIVLVLGLLIGGALSRFSIERNFGFGAMQIGQWTAWPKAGSSEADPYTRAKVAADGEVPLGAAEGIAFHGRVDSQGNPLDLSCNYRISGATPVARFWTITAHRPDGSVIGSGLGGAATLISRNIVREIDGSFQVHVGPKLATGNWLRTADGSEGPMELVLRLYDSPITASAGIVDPQMPEIRLQGCRT